MFRASVLLSCATLALGLAAGDLKVAVNAVSSSVSSIDDIVLTAVVSNPTDKDIRVIRTNNVLDNLPTKSFSVTKDDQKVTFTGAFASFDLEVDANWVTIPAGQSVAVNHTVSNLYDFESHGTGTYLFAPTAIFQTSNQDEGPLFVDVEGVKVEVKSDGDVSFRDLIPPTASLSTVSCGDANRAKILRDSLASARSLAGGAATDIRSHPNSATWNKFFGGNNRDDIWWRFDIIAGDLASSGTRKIYCNQDPAGICSRAGAYTRVVRSGGNIVGSDIFACDSFYNFQDTPNVCRQNINDITASKGGVMLHELSHATAGTDDVAYSCNTVQGLTAQQKLNNADNYQCMALNIYRIYNC
ncbi:hypothetical protein AAF712_010663 [Marasmius tenuissimus]|uniref:deuterolysin n=1 Tax=Marasmius tenuissimus TaxID=585030 RepID=A0ABR2ZL73_9AGAR